MVFVLISPRQTTVCVVTRTPHLKSVRHNTIMIQIILCIKNEFIYISKLQFENTCKVSLYAHIPNKKIQNNYKSGRTVEN